MHPLVLEQIGHALRVRVIQELQILARKLRRTQPPYAPSLLRRLTRAEWDEIKLTGAVPFKNAVALLVIPPVNRDPTTKQRPEANDSSMPNEEERQCTPKIPQKSFPSSVLYPAVNETNPLATSRPDLLPSTQTPLYHAASLFPSPTQRAALHAAVLQVLQAERTAKRRATRSPNATSAPRKGQHKGSHAILICSDEQTLLRGDTVPLAVALWRLRLWEAGSENVQDTPVEWFADSSALNLQ